MNKYLSAAVAASLLALPPLARADDATFKDDTDKVSYAMGVQMGRKMHQNGIDVSPDALAQGLKDGLAGGATKLTDEEMQTALQTFNEGLRQKMQAQMASVAADNKTKGDAYLAANAKKDGWKTTASGLQYKVLTTGTGPKPKTSDTVVTEYRGTLIDGTEFDSSYKHEPTEFKVGEVIPGWTEALQMMPVGSKWQLAIPSSLAYGENGPPPIGPDSVLLFDVELKSIKAADAASAAPSPAGQ